MTEPRPEEFIGFLDLLTQDAPRGYKPWLFRVEAGSKAPDLSYGSWKDERARLDRDEAIRWMQSGGNVGIAGRPDGPLINVDIDDEDATTIDDLKPTLIARSRSRTGIHAWYFEAAGADIPNIPTDEAGEVRANWQYVVAPGSYVETDDDDVPDGEREHAGYYTVERADAVTSLRCTAGATRLLITACKHWQCSQITAATASVLGLGTSRAALAAVACTTRTAPTSGTPGSTPSGQATSPRTTRCRTQHSNTSVVSAAFAPSPRYPTSTTPTVQTDACQRMPTTPPSKR